MIRVGLISDTHAHLHPKLFEVLGDCDEIWHAGDIGDMNSADRLSEFKPLKAVFGNIDDHKIRMVYPEIQVFSCEDMKVCMMHIAGYPGKYNKAARALILNETPDIFVAGHSHILKIIYDNQYGHLHLNPGSAGNSGLHKKITMLSFSIDGRDISDMKIFEFGRGSSNPVD